MDLGVTVGRTIERYAMFSRGDRVAVAVSGGADSVCLLEVLTELAPRWDLRLSMVHVNHHLRGAESDGDAEFVRGLAAARGLEFAVCDLDLSGAGNLEQAARAGRLQFFHGFVERGLVDRVAVGHTRSDQAETVLFRLLRGSGSAGLAAIRPATPQGLVRPLIEVERDEVERYLRERGIGWREDASNRCLDFARNRIRHELLPQLEREWNPAIVETLANTAEIALGEEEYWREEIGRLAARHLERANGAVLLDVRALAGMPMAVGRRLVRRVIEDAKGDLRGIDFAHVAAVMELAQRTQGSGCVQLPRLEVRRSFSWLRFGARTATRAYCLSADVPGVLQIPGTELAIVLELVEKLGTTSIAENVYNSGMGCLDWKRLSGPLRMRNWRPGDQYQPAGNSSVVKIKNLFQAARVPHWERAQWPVLTDGTTIVWARRFGPAVALRARPENTPILTVTEVQRTEGSAA